MSTWIFEPGHTEAEFRARHMMVTWVRGLFKDIHGHLELDWNHCLDATFEGEIDATGIWTGEPERDAHLRSADFLDVQKHPKISFRGGFTERTADTAFKGEVELTIRDLTRTAPLDIAYIGEWRTPWWAAVNSRSAEIGSSVVSKRFCRFHHPTRIEPIKPFRRWLLGVAECPPGAVVAKHANRRSRESEDRCSGPVLECPRLVDI
jgi:polyisoprenoid-binding protein YceI